MLRPPRHPPPMTRTTPIGSFTLVADDTHQTQRSMLDNGVNYERHIVAELERLAPTTLGYIDIGANVGIHLLNMRRFNPACPLIAFEPSPYNLQSLLVNVAQLPPHLVVHPC